MYIAQTYLLPQLQYLKAFKIRQIPPLFPLLPLLRPRTLLPLPLHLLLLPRALDCSTPRPSRQLLDYERREDHIVQRCGVPGHGKMWLRGRAIDQNLFCV